MMLHTGDRPGNGPQYVQIGRFRGERHSQRGVGRGAVETGTAQAGSMSGKADMGEYGPATWTAVRA